VQVRGVGRGVGAQVATALAGVRPGTAEESRGSYDDRAPVVDTPSTSRFGGAFDTAPIVGLEELTRADAASQARSDQARAHEAAAEVLADRGDWRRAYHHLHAALELARVERTQPVHVPEQLRHEVDRLRRERAEAREQSRRDSLTATWNRRYLDERLATLRDSGHTTVCVALADVDHFKQVNDTFGHAVGDQVLRRLVAVMSEDLPDDAFCARYGGEEFALVLPGTGHDEAVRLCEAARARVDGHPWDDLADGLRVTASVGVSCLPVAADADALPGHPGLDAVDALLYVAKRAGRNAVAYRDDEGTVRLAGPAAARRGLAPAVRAMFPSS
jgi:diguanylate cyclase (GGDEF)-like protein